MRNAKTINEELIRNAFATVMTYNGADPTPLLEHVDAALKTLASAKKAKPAPAKGKATQASEAEEESC